jgi:transcriptional regulator of heat shock response
MHGLIRVFIESKQMIMKTLKYILLGIMLISIIPLCNSQTPVKTKQVITLQSVPKNATSKLLAESKEILSRRLGFMGLRDIQITQDNKKSELVITVGDTISNATLSEILLIQGNVSFKADTILVLNKENLLEVYANFDNPEQPTLFITFKENKWKVWENITARNMNKPVAFVMDDKVYSAPLIKDKISHGKISLTGGGFSKTELRKLVAIISSGTVPLKFNIVSKN